MSVRAARMRMVTLAEFFGIRKRGHLRRRDWDLFLSDGGLNSRFLTRRYAAVRNDWSLRFGQG
jgi:high-affinity nickel permease